LHLTLRVNKETEVLKMYLEEGTRSPSD